MNRISRLEAYLKDTDLNIVALNPGSTLKYLTGLEFHLMERPVVFLYAPPKEPAIVLPELEMEKMKALDFSIKSFPYSEDPESWQKALNQACQYLNISSQKIGLEPTRLRFLELRMLEAAAPQAEFVNGESVLNSLRLLKDEVEISAMQKAADIAQQAMENTIKTVRIGMTEREIASELSFQLLRCGSSAELPFQPDVSLGINTANPHATPSDRAIKANDLLLIDWGARYEGYCSDITRVFAIGDIDPKLKEIHKIVLQANTAGRETAKPGIPAGAADVAARQVIEAAGYGKYFTHRTGHGLGLEIHEPPYIRDGNQLLLAKGMTFTIEPGIYLSELGGVRIEDDVVITEDGARSLTTMTRELRQIA